ncbi:uncharacterized protein LOC122063047 [Macadamia integrifolia]|uniref:uncharacterized protein LOC122063047 n=1 Tax=Macadamia integrifolia TaxID=60698 RepID=UPI001C4E9EB0|nr:uncharacterized protein LOC122063047 [Macadamia integrifolia]
MWSGQVTATSLPWHPLLSPSSHCLSSQRRAISTRRVLTIQAFRRSDFDRFGKRVVSGEAWKEAWRSANDGFELLLFDAKKAAERFDRRYSVSRRLSSVVQSATDKAREIDRELEIERRWRTFTLDFSRNWPRYRRQLNDFLDTPLGRTFSGSCPACKQQFMGYKNQVVRCVSCGNIVWQPKDNFSSGGGGRDTKSSSSGPDIIDVDFEEK